MAEFERHDSKYGYETVASAQLPSGSARVISTHQHIMVDDPLPETVVGSCLVGRQVYLDGHMIYDPVHAAEITGAVFALLREDAGAR